MVVSLHRWLPFLLVLHGSFSHHLPEVLNEGPPKPPHPFYISVTELNHNQADNVLELSCKMFADDFENALKARYRTSIDIAHPKDPKQTDKFVFEYVQKHIQLKVNNNSVNLEFIGFEKEGEAVWCYLQVKDITNVKKLEIMNNILYEMYNNQIGIIHASSGGQRKSTKLTYPDTNAIFEW